MFHTLNKHSLGEIRRRVGPIALSSFLPSIYMPCPQSMPEPTANNPSCPQDGHLHGEVCACTPSRKSPQNVSAFLSQTVHSLVQPQAAQPEEGRPASGVQSASSECLVSSGWSAGSPGPPTVRMAGRWAARHRLQATATTPSNPYLRLKNMYSRMQELETICLILGTAFFC